MPKTPEVSETDFSGKWIDKTYTPDTNVCALFSC